MGNNYAIKDHTHYSQIKAYTQRVRFSKGRQAEQSETCRTMNSIVKRSHFDRIISNQINHHKSKHQRALCRFWRDSSDPVPHTKAGGELNNAAAQCNGHPAMECAYSLVFLLLPLKAPSACFRGDQRQVTSVQGTHTLLC